jgi:alkylation response protein AidB-like acyl-CoA dehydrogenase
VDIASARSLLVAAARAIDRGSADHGLSLLAKAEASEVFRSAADGLIQVSGGIGFTWEHDAHLFFRRARSTAVLGGTPEELRDRAVSEGCLDLLLPVSP